VEAATSFKDIKPDSTVTDIIPASTLTGDNLLEPPKIPWVGVKSVKTMAQALG
jgi:hypothetical protein